MENQGPDEDMKAQNDALLDDLKYKCYDVLLNTVSSAAYCYAHDVHVA